MGVGNTINSSQMGMVDVIQASLMGVVNLYLNTILISVLVFFCLIPIYKTNSS